ncbi:hypothetical protein Q9Q94_15325 [Uliginosibacterium sp. 31-16]|uniref:hypothetical protein n=1 Tax=Uliginosibacterium sp. 31-16 TaxID=3068315 RepID=UPI00273FDFDC|nr:hypothetical protein [Uliginosibacterium sp. 31-16]MDP5240912.1 hypothetical protein [Uliginosibacterium sp. 31-16]
MASMGVKEIAKQYFERLAKALKPKAELERIYSDLNNLVFTASQKPIDRNTKIQILDELESLIRRKPSLEDISESATYDSIRKSTTASDNSDILDVISAMKKRG